MLGIWTFCEQSVNNLFQASGLLQRQEDCTKISTKEVAEIGRLCAGNQVKPRQVLADRSSTACCGRWDGRSDHAAGPGSALYWPRQPEKAQASGALPDGSRLYGLDGGAREAWRICTARGLVDRAPCIAFVRSVSACAPIGPEQAILSSMTAASRPSCLPVAAECCVKHTGTHVRSP